MHRHRNTSDNTQELLLTLGRLVDQALENIKLQRARAEMGLALQRHMLPTELPDFPGIRIGARYSPSQDGMAVGGDFYDAFPMRDGVAGITIGDVQGHGVEAAAFMGEARASLRALASVTTDPGTVLSCANDLLISLGGDLFTTCCLVSIAPHSGELFVARAGHVPIVWGTDDGDSGISQDDGGVPLGILHDQWYPVTHAAAGAARISGPADRRGRGGAVVPDRRGARRGGGGGRRGRMGPTPASWPSG